MTGPLKPSLNWLLIFVPIAIGLHYLVPASELLVFLAACLAIIPLAGWLGQATEQIAHHTSEGIGGLLNATFGNAAEMIIALMALRRGLYDIVKASLTGSILGNILLVLGAAMLAGGLRFKTQQFNPVGSQMQATMLLLAAIAMVLPAAYHHLTGSAARAHEIDLSLEISVVLLITYGLSLLFSLHTHKQVVSSASDAELSKVESSHRPWSVARSLAVLALATVLIAWLSEILVGSVEHAAEALGMTSIFVGIIVVAIIGNAAEHSTAVLVAIKNRMDMSLGIAIGSSIQIALFVTPVLVLASLLIGPRPMDLVFTPAEVIAVVLAALITAQIAGDGQSNWLEGVQLLAVYLILAIVFYFLPESSHSAALGPQTVP